MKTAKKVFFATALTLLVSIIFLAGFLLVPQNLFANHSDHNNFKIYSNKPIDIKLNSILDHSLSLVKKSELFDKAYHYDIFIADNTLYNYLDSKILGPAMSRSIDNNVILKVGLDIDNDKLIGAHNTRNLTQTIAHEMIHCLQVNKYGKLKFNPWHHPEMWKLEGYPEYIAMQDYLTSKKYSLNSEIKKLEAFENTSNNGWYETEKGQYDPVVYFRGRLMIEYLIDIKGLNYDEILNEKFTADEVYTDMIKWAEKSK